MSRRPSSRLARPAKRVRAGKSRLIIESLEDRTVPTNGQWVAVFEGLPAADNLLDQLQYGQNLLAQSGVPADEVSVVQALDFNGTYLLQAEREVTRRDLITELHGVPGFVFVTDTYPDLPFPWPGGPTTPSTPGGFESGPGPGDPGGDSQDPVLTGTWSQTNLPPTSIGTMMLLSDGRVLAQGGGVTNAWYQLRPDAAGSYVNGAWSPLAPMGLERLYFGSNVLSDGRVFLVGGEYSGPSGTANWTNTGEIYNPVTNSWSPIAPFPQTSFGDGQTQILPDGRIIAGYLSGTQTYIYDPAANTWSFAANKLRNDRNNEETWVLLPDHSILSYDIFSSIAEGVGHAQRYVPATNTWVDAGTVPVSLSSSSLGYEIGPALLLPDGRVFQVGANSNTALYNPSTNTWAAGPIIPNGKGGDDTPAAMLPNGHVIFTADTPLFNGPTQLFDFDPVANTITQMTSLPSQLVSDLSGPAYTDRMLMLPNGQMLFTTGTSNRVWVFTADGAPADAWRPTISGVAQNADGTFTLTGTQLNGISEGASYGDDAEMSTNYPIVRLTSTSGNVHYARTYNWSNTGVATGSTPVTTQFALPAGLPNGQYSLAVVANGIASAAVTFNQPFQLSVLSSAPAAGATVAAPPTSYVINFSDAVDPASLQASDLLVNGSPADGFTLNAAHTSATFTFSTDPVAGQGVQTMAIAAGSIAKEANPSEGIAAFNASFRYDATPLAVDSTDPPVTGAFTLPAPFTYVVNFNEPIAATSVGTDDLTLSAGTVTAATATGPSQATYTITGVTAEGTLTVTVGAGKVTDEFGNPNPAAFTNTYGVDTGTVAFPTPLAAKTPLGSLVYDPVASGFIAPAGDTDSFTLNVDPGQTVTVVVRPTAAALQPTVALRDPAGVTLGTASAGAANQDAILQTVPAATGGVYTVTVGGNGTSTGSYTVQVILNAAEELERHAGQPSNNSPGTAQNIDSASLALGGPSARMAALGRADSTTTSDFYAVTLAAGDTVTVGLQSLTGGAVDVRLADAANQTLAQGVAGATNLSRRLNDFVAPAAGTYFLAVTGATNTDYTLAVTRNADFDTEANDSSATAQYVGASRGMLGNLEAGSGLVRVSSFTVSLGTLVALGHDPATGDLFAYGAFGSQIAEFTPAGVEVPPRINLTGTTSDEFDLDFLPEAVNLGGTTVPAGSLLQVNGDDTPDTVRALNKDTGAVLATLNVSGATSSVGGTYHPGRHTLYLVDWATDVIREVNPATGAILATFPVAPAGSPTFDVFYGDMDVDPATGNLLIVGSTQSRIRVLTPTGGFVRDIDVTALGVSSMSAIAVNDSNGDMWVGTTGGTVIRLATASSNDWYTVAVNAGDTLAVQTSTPAAGPGEFVNSLNPHIELYNPSGGLVASGAVLGDGKNEQIGHAAAATGLYRLRVTSDGGTGGEYFVSVAGNTGAAQPAFAVTTATPANGAILIAAPATYTVDFNDAVLQTSVTGADLQVDGIPATAVTFVDGDTARFTLPAGLGAGTHTIAIAAGAVLDVQSTPVQAFGATFFVDNVAPRVTGTSVAPGAVLAPGSLTVQTTFSEAMKVSNLTSDDFSLRGNFRNVTYSAASFSFNGAGTVLTLTYTGLPDDNYSLTLFSGASSGTNFTDAAGNALDGEFSGTFPSGNGTAGGNFVLGFSMDPGTEAYPAPLAAKSPPGSLVYDPSLARVVAFAGDTDSFTLAVDPGQTVSVLVTPTTTTLVPTVEVRDPSGTIVGAGTAPAVGKKAVVSTAPVGTGGTYTVTASGGGTAGLYTVQTVLNAALEAESNDGPGNSTPATAQSLTPSFVTLATPQTSVQRGAVLGRFAGDDDFYSFGLAAGESVTLGVAASSTGTSLFGSRADITGLSNPSTVTYGDLNGDARPDMVAAGYTTNTVNVRLGNGNGTFGSATSYPLAGSTPWTVALGDVNGDGRRDIVAANINSSDVSVLLGNGAGGFGPATTYPMGTNCYGVAVGDLNADGIGDVVSADWNSNTVSVRLGQASGTLGARTGYAVSSGPFVGPVAVSLGDLNGDGKLDVVTANYTGSSVSVLPGNGVGGLGGPSTFAMGTSCYGLALADFNGDTRLDVVTANYDSSNVSVRLGDGAGGFGAVANYASGGSNPIRTEAGDLNADGRPDIVVSNANSNTVGVLLNAGGGTFGPAQTFATGTYPNGLALADLNSDGLPDMSTANYSSSTVSVWLNTTTSVRLEQVDGTGGVLATGGPAGNLTSVLTYVAPAAGTYYARLSGAGSTDYNLLATRNAGFDTEANNSFAAAQSIGGAAGVVGHVTGGGAGGLFDLTGPTVSGPVVLTGTKITLGFNPDGSFITASGGTGIRYNGVEFVVPGAPLASFTVGYNGLTFTNNGANGVSQITGITRQDVSFGTLKGLKITGTAGASLRVERVVVFNQADDFVTIATRLTSLSGTALTSVATLENIDPDQDSGLGSFSTLNDVVLGGQFVRASGPTSGLTVGLGSADSRRVVSAEGFDNRNPFDIINSPVDPNGANADVAIAQAFNFGGLAGGGSVSGIAIMAFGTSTAAADAVFSANAGGTTLANEDWYAMDVASTANVLRVETGTPADGAGEFVNTLNPRIELYDPAGGLVASGTPLADGRNEFLQVTPAATGTYRLRVTGQSATSGEYVLTRNFSPVVTADATSSIGENGTATVTGTINDPDALDPHTVVITWGPGEGSTTLNLAAGVLTFTASHQYADDNPTGTPADTYPIGVAVTDSRGASGAASTAVTVNNVAPAGVALNSGAIDESGTFTLSGSFADPGALDTHTVLIDWGPGEGTTTLDLPAGVLAFTASHQYPDDSPSGTASDVYPATVTVTDDDTGTGTGATAVTVNNVAPSGVVLNSGTIDENGTFTLAGSFADPGSQDTHAVVVTWGDGSSETLNLAAGVLTFTASHQYLDDSPTGTPSDAYEISVAVTDDDTGSGYGNSSVAVNNVAPSEVILNSGSIDEDDTFTLAGSFADPGSQDTHTVLIDWGPGEGSTTLTLAAGVLTFSASHQYRDDNPTGTASDAYPATVAVTDDDTGSAAAATTVTVNNVAPVVGPITGPSPAPAVRGQTVTFAGTFTDVGALDTHQVSWDFGDGTVIPFHPSTDPGALTPSHVFTAAGPYTVTLTVRDDDTGTTASSKSVTVQVVALQNDPLIPGAVDLVVGGGNATDDVIRFTAIGTGGTVRVNLNDVVLGDYLPTGRLIAFGQGGNDDIQVVNNLTLTAWLYGGAGNDRLAGGTGPTLLIGGDGNDELRSGGGRTMMIGGAGADRLVGGPGDDLEIGGSTAYDANDSALHGLLSEWASSRNYSTRVANLRGTGSGPRLNGNSFLTAATVVDDGARDTLTGGAGLDWFWALATDLVTDLGGGEVIN